MFVCTKNESTQRSDLVFDQYSISITITQESVSISRLKKSDQCILKGQQLKQSLEHSKTEGFAMVIMSEQ